MKKQQFKATLHAARNVVWHALWHDTHYRNWTSAFSEGSSAVSDWKEGSEILFLNGKGSGMYSVIDKKEDPAIMAFKHLGEIKEDTKQPHSDWAGAMEVYTLTENGTDTDLVVEMDMDENWQDYFLKTWPVALEKLRAIAENPETKMITVQTSLNAPVEKVWEFFTGPGHITQWNHASDDWHTPAATNDLRPGGRFSFTMAAKDGSFSFDFGGAYDVIEKYKQISYTMDDGRKAHVYFSTDQNKTTVTEIFEAETMHSLEMQLMGWQAILDNFKKYTEQTKKQ